MARPLVPWKRDSSHNSRAGHPGSRRCSSLAYALYSRSSRLAIRAPRSGTYASNHASRGLAGGIVALCLLAPYGHDGLASRAQARNAREVIADLSAVEPVARAQAACALRNMGDSAFEALSSLTDLLADASPVPSSVCDRRWSRGDANDMTTPGEQAAAALVAIGTRAYPPLLKALSAPAWAARRNAAWGLGALDDQRAVPVLITALTDREPGVREQVAWALGALDGASAVPALAAALKDSDPRVRRQAAWALGAIDDHRAVAPLATALTDADDRTREQAAWALGAIDDRTAVPPLLATLTDKTARVRKQAAWALGAIDDPRAVDGLVRALADEHAGVREQSAWALGAIGDARAMQSLLSGLKDPDAGVRRQAAWAIGVIGR